MKQQNEQAIFIYKVWNKENSRRFNCTVILQTKFGILETQRLIIQHPYDDFNLLFEPESEIFIEFLFIKYFFLPIQNIVFVSIY